MVDPLVFRDSARFVALDFETANKKRSSAIACAAVRVEGDRVVRAAMSLVGYGDEDEDWLFEESHHGIARDDVKTSPTFRHVWQWVYPVVADADYVVAHNVRFDVEVLRASFADEQGRLPFPEKYGVHTVDTLAICREVWPEWENHRLETAAKMLGVPHNPHDALSDAFVVVEIIKRVRKMRRKETANEQRTPTRNDGRPRAFRAARAQKRVR